METPTKEVSPQTDGKVETIRNVMAHASQAPPDRWVDAAAMLLVDAITGADLPPMEAFLDEASRLANDPHIDQARLSALAFVAQWGVTRTIPLVLGRSLNLESNAGRILKYVSATPGCSSKDIHISLDIAEPSISRIGTELERDGLIYRIRAGKWRRWKITRAGENTLNAAILFQKAGSLEGEQSGSVLNVLLDFDGQRNSGSSAVTGIAQPEPDSAFTERIRSRKQQIQDQSNST